MELIAYDFLKEIEDSTLRKAALNNLSSYNQVYDVLAESLQNAVDAVEDRYFQNAITAKTKIDIIFDKRDRKITVIDTGTGMPWENVRNAPSLNVTNKKEGGERNNTHKKTRGEKGVGLSFLTFICNNIKIRTCNGDYTIEAEIKNANDWMHERSNEKPLVLPITQKPLEKSEVLGSDTYTLIELTDVRTVDYCDLDIFSFSMYELIYVIRTKTSIGNTEKLLIGREPEPYIDVNLRYINEDGSENMVNIPYLFLCPSEYFSDESKITYEKFIELQQKNKLHLAHGKSLIYQAIKTTQSGKKIFCYVFSTAAKIFQELSKDLEIKEQWSPDDWVGIYIATRGMPTGIKIDPPVTYSSGYWRRIFMILQDDNMNFDIGRKTLRGQSKPMMQQIANQVWDDISPYLQALSPNDNESTKRTKQGKITQLFQEALGWDNLDFPRIPYVKIPKREQMVVALFYELVGANILKGYKTLRNNTIDQYDAFIQYQIDKSLIGINEAAQQRSNIIEELIIVEFKYNAQDLLNDLLENAKRYQDINLLVCWDIQPEKLKTKGIDIEDISQESVFYYGSTHIIYFPGIYQAGDILHVIELKKFINNNK